MLNKNIGDYHMIKKLFFSFLASCVFLIGCSAEDTSTGADSQVSTNNANQILISENIEIEPEEIELSDFSIIKMDTDYIYSLFGSVNDAQKHLGNFTPDILYHDTDDDFYSILAQKWSQLYVEWLKGNGVILRIVVEEKGYETKRGIEIGDSISDIDDVYGKDTGYRSNVKIEFDLGNEEYETMMALVFHLENDVVVKIEITQGT